MHCWQYMMRIFSHLKTPVIVSESQLRCSTLSQTINLSRNGIQSMNLRLSQGQPTFQFTSLIELSSASGNTLWSEFFIFMIKTEMKPRNFRGKLTLVHEAPQSGGTAQKQPDESFEIAVPLIKLDVRPPLLTGAERRSHNDDDDESERNPIN